MQQLETVAAVVMRLRLLTWLLSFYCFIVGVRATTRRDMLNIPPSQGQRESQHRFFSKRSSSILAIEVRIRRINIAWPGIFGVVAAKGWNLGNVCGME